MQHTESGIKSTESDRFSPENRTLASVMKAQRLTVLQQKPSMCSDSVPQCSQKKTKCAGKLKACARKPNDMCNRHENQRNRMQHTESGIKSPESGRFGAGNRTLGSGRKLYLARVPQKPNLRCDGLPQSTSRKQNVHGKVTIILRQTPRSPMDCGHNNARKKN